MLKIVLLLLLSCGNSSSIKENNKGKKNIVSEERKKETISELKKYISLKNPTDSNWIKEVDNLLNEIGILDMPLVEGSYDNYSLLFFALHKENFKLANLILEHLDREQNKKKLRNS